MPEKRMTIVVADDPDTQQVKIAVLGDMFGPAPIEAPTFEEAWTLLGDKLSEQRKEPPPTGPWQPGG